MGNILPILGFCQICHSKLKSDRKLVQSGRLVLVNNLCYCCHVYENLKKEYYNYDTYNIETIEIN